jgi:hypothetical protein
LAAEAFVVGARDALARNDTATVRRILDALKALANTGPWAAHAQDNIAAPMLEHFRKLCGAIREECSVKIVREPNAAKRNKSACDAALKRFRTEIQPELERTIQLVSPDHQVAEQSREEAALGLCGIAIDYTWADDFIGSEQLHKEALQLAHGTVGAIRIEHGLAQVREQAKQQRVFGALTPISSAPTLYTLNGVGFTIYGRSDYDEDSRSYVATYYFVVLFVPILPVCRYRVISVEDGKYRFLGKVPLRKADRWHVGIAAAVILALIFGGTVNSSQNSNPPSSEHSTA